MPGQEGFISFNTWTALFILLNTVTMFLVLKKFLFKPVMKMIKDRQQEIDDMYAANRIIDAFKAKIEFPFSHQFSKPKSQKSGNLGITLIFQRDSAFDPTSLLEIENVVFVEEENNN